MKKGYLRKLNHYIKKHQVIIVNPKSWKSLLNQPSDKAIIKEVRVMEETKIETVCSYRYYGGQWKADCPYCGIDQTLPGEIVRHKCRGCGRVFLTF